MILLAQILIFILVAAFVIAAISLGKDLFPTEDDEN